MPDARTVDLDRERQLRRDDPIDFSLPPIMVARERVIASARAICVRPWALSRSVDYQELADALAEYDAALPKEPSHG